MAAAEDVAAAGKALSIAGDAVLTAAKGRGLSGHSKLLAFCRTLCTGVLGQAHVDALSIRKMICPRQQRVSRHHAPAWHSAEPMQATQQGL